MTQVAAPSYYRATATPYAAYGPLQGREQARIAIIGGGFAGLNTALGLAERGVENVVLLEREEIAFGASGRNGGFVTPGYSLGPQALYEQLGAARAAALYQLTCDAMQCIRRRIADYAIACDSVEHGFILANWFRDSTKLKRHQQLLAEHFNRHWEWVEPEELVHQIHTTRYHGGLFTPDALHLQPLDYAIGLAAAATARGLVIHEQSGAVTLHREGSRWRITTRQGVLLADQVVLACGGYLAGLHGPVDRAVVPIATYVVVTEPLHDRLEACLSTRAAIHDSRFSDDYYRALSDTRLLWGGRISTCDRSPRSIERLLHADMLRVFPQLRGLKIEYAWSGLMGYARHQMPQIGSNGQGLWWVQSFGGHGLASTCALGDVMASALAQGDERWKQFADYGLSSTYRPLGYAGVQAKYWWLRSHDWLRMKLEH